MIDEPVSEAFSDDTHIRQLCLISSTFPGLYTLRTKIPLYFQRRFSVIVATRIPWGPSRGPWKRIDKSSPGTGLHNIYVYREWCPMLAMWIDRKGGAPDAWNVTFLADDVGGVTDENSSVIRKILAHLTPVLAESGVPSRHDAFWMMLLPPSTWIEFGWHEGIGPRRC